MIQAAKEGLEELPDNWEWCRLGEIITLEYGKGLRKDKRDPEGRIPVYGSNGIIGHHSVPLVTEPCLVIGRKGSVGRVHLSGTACWPIDTTYYTVSPSEINLSFLYHLLETFRLDSLDKSTTIPGINRNDAYSVRVPVAPFPEQRRIMAKIEELFTRLDAGVESLKIAKGQLEAYRQSVLKAAFDGRFTARWREESRGEIEPPGKILERILAEQRLIWADRQREKYAARGKSPPKGWRERYKEPAAPDTSDLGDLPEGWTWASVEQLASPAPRSIQSGPFGSNLRHSEFQDTGILAIGIDNVVEGTFSYGKRHRISPEKFKELEKYAARPLDVLITVMATVGRCCVVPETIEPAIITKHVYRITAKQDIVLPHFLMLALGGATVVREQIRRQVRGQTRPGINGRILKNLVTPLPPLIEQGLIVAEVERRLSLIQASEKIIEANLKRAEGLRQSILKEAFSGNLVPQDPRDEPANVLLERIKRGREGQRSMNSKVRPAQVKIGSFQVS